MKKILLLGLGICLFTLSSSAQGEVDNAEPSFILKLAPFKLLAPEMNLSISLERKFNDRFGVQVQADYIYSIWNTGDTSVRRNLKASGFRIIPEFRYYYADYDMVMGYIGANVMFKQLNTNYEEFRTKTDGSGQVFLQLTPIEVKKRVIAPHFIAGWLFYLDKPKRLSIDFNAGIGFRTRRVTSSVPFIEDGRFTFTTNANAETISAACNLKLGYSFYR